MDDTFKIIDISTGKLIQTLSDHKSYISDVAYDANKRKIYTKIRTYTRKHRKKIQNEKKYTKI